MGAMGPGAILGPGCSRQTSRSGKLHLLREKDQKLSESQGQGFETADDVEELLSEWWGCRTMMQKTDLDERGAPVLSLPDDLMTFIFAKLQRQSLAMTRMVCSSWKRVAEQQELAALRRKMNVAEGWIYALAETPDGTPFRAYDPLAAKWSILPPTPGRSEGQQWQGFSCVAVGHKLLLIGGTRTQKNLAAAMVCNDVVIYDALTNKWSKGANMNTPRSWFAAAVLGAKVYVAGGQGNTKFLNSAEVYDLKTDKWSSIANMSVVRSSCQGVGLDGQFWVIAGEYVKNHYDNNQRSSAEVYDAETDTWRFIPNMCLDDNKVLDPSAVVDGKLMCVHQKKIMAYNTELNSWDQLGHINGGEVYARPYSRFGFACESVGSNLYIIGGTREYAQNRHRYCTSLNTVEICDLGVPKQSPQLWWKLGQDMGQGRGIMSASSVVWL